MSATVLALVLGLVLGFFALIVAYFALLAYLARHGRSTAAADRIVLLGSYDSLLLLSELSELRVTLADRDGRDAIVDERLDDHDADIHALHRRLGRQGARISTTDANVAAHQQRLGSHDNRLDVHHGRLDALEGDRVTQGDLTSLRRELYRLLRHHAHAAASRFSWWWVLAGAVIGGIGFLIMNRVIKPGTVSALHFPASRYLFGSPWHTIGMAIFITAMGMLVGGALGGLISAARRGRITEDHDVAEHEIAEQQA